MLSDFPAAIRFYEKPIDGRFLTLSFVFFAVVILAPTLAVAQEASAGFALTEEMAVERALARPALADVTEGTVGVARSEAIREGLRPDPEIKYDREQTSGAQGTAQDVLMISQRFDLSGRRALRTTGASHRARAASHRGDARRMGIEAEVRLLFHQLLVAQLRATAIQTWVGRIEGALEVVSLREAAGDASAYDRRRLERELANARGRLAVHQADSDRAWARLAARIGQTGPPGSGSPTLSGALLPEPSPPAEQLLSRIENRPDILALGAHVEAAQADGKAATRWWVPRLALGAGWIDIDLGADRANGYVAMAAVSVPLFDRNQDEVLRAASEERIARGRRELALSEARGEVRGRVAALTRLIQAAQRFSRKAIGGSGVLILTAEAGYAGDELGILELLDAYRSGSEDEMTVLDLELAARRARIELDLLTGGNTR